MAPPSPRRPGFSRRAQYSIFAAYVVALAGAATALLLVLTARFDPEGNSAIQSAATDLTLPVSKAGHWVRGSFVRIGDNIADYFDAAAKNAGLREELATTRRKALTADQLRIENRRLKQLLEIQDKAAVPIAAGALVGSTGASSRRYATLALGANKGVRNGQPVIGPDGLVGRIVATGRQSARVLLIVDGGNVTPVKRATDGTPALAIGRGDGLLILRPLSSGSAPFRRGDLFVTSGSGGIYRPGIPVARVTKPGREGTVSAPAADPTRLDYALVEPVYQEPAPMPPSKVQQPEAE